MLCSDFMFAFFFFNDTATTEIYTLSLHDALPIFEVDHQRRVIRRYGLALARLAVDLCCHDAFADRGDRKSTRLNSSHQIISYAVFCLKKKKQTHFLLLPYPHTHPTTPHPLDHRLL